MANTNFVGDFEAEWLITRSGDIRLKAYNETNDRYYTKTNLTTQGVGIMYVLISINGVIYISGINGGYAISGNGRS